MAVEEHNSIMVEEHVCIETDFYLGTCIRAGRQASRR